MLPPCQECAVHKYRAFIDTARCLATITADMDDVCTSLKQLEDDLPLLTAQCDAFEADAQIILNSRNSNKQLHGE